MFKFDTFLAMRTTCGLYLTSIYCNVYHMWLTIRGFIYQFVCHCDSQYVDHTSQCLEEQIKQHIPRSITNPPASHNCQSLSRSCKANTRPQQFHESSIGQHLLDNTQCALHYSNEKFSILAQSLFFSPFCS